MVLNDLFFDGEMLKQKKKRLNLFMWMRRCADQKRTEKGGGESFQAQACSIWLLSIHFILVHFSK